MTKEEQLLEKRFLELANTTYNRGIPLYTDFLSLYEQDLFMRLKKKLPPIYTSLDGGYSLAERKMACFLPDKDLFHKNIPIKTIKILAVNSKFSDVLNHRDYLGALMNLGIERAVLGDIVFDEDSTFLFCKETMVEYIIENLSFVKHTNIRCEEVELENQEFSIKYEEAKGSVASLRLDNVLSLAFGGSRGKLSAYIEGKKVFVNSRLIESNSYILKDDDIVSVRGLGKFVFKETVGLTKKGRSYITLKKYI